MLVAQRAVQGSPSDAPKRLTSAFRLAGPRGYDHVIRATCIADRWFKVFFLENGKKNARLGMIVGKKVLFRANERNRVKRCIREVFRQHPIRHQNLDIVVMLRRVAAEHEHDLPGSLKTLFSRVESECAKF